MESDSEEEREAARLELVKQQLVRVPASPSWEMDAQSGFLTHCPFVVPGRAQ
jgi:hypothetical protein